MGSQQDSLQQLIRAIFLFILIGFSLMVAMGIIILAVRTKGKSDGSLPPPPVEMTQPANVEEGLGHSETVPNQGDGSDAPEDSNKQPTVPPTPDQGPGSTVPKKQESPGDGDAKKSKSDEAATDKDQSGDADAENDSPDQDSAEIESVKSGKDSQNRDD